MDPAFLVTPPMAFPQVARRLEPTDAPAPSTADEAVPKAAGVEKCRGEVLGCVLEE